MQRVKMTTWVVLVMKKVILESLGTRARIFTRRLIAHRTLLDWVSTISWIRWDTIPQPPSIPCRGRGRAMLEAWQASAVGPYPSAALLSWRRSNKQRSSASGTTSPWSAPYLMESSSLLAPYVCMLPTSQWPGPTAQMRARYGTWLSAPSEFSSFSSFALTSVATWALWWACTRVPTTWMASSWWRARMESCTSKCQCRKGKRNMCQNIMASLREGGEIRQRTQVSVHPVQARWQLFPQNWSCLFLLWSHHPHDFELRQAHLLNAGMLQIFQL